MSAANNLIKEFCQSIGMEPLGFDEQNQRSLSFDDKIVVTFLDDKGDQVTALAFIADSKGNPVILRKLLEQNFIPEAHGGGRFTLEPGTDRVVLTRQWDALTATVPVFSDNLEAFVNSAMQAQTFILDNCDKAPQAAVPTDAPVAAPVDSLAAAYQAI